MPMLEQKRGSDIGSTLPEAAFEQQQRRRMLVALGVLLLALISVLIKDRQFWFPPSTSSESETLEQSAPLQKPHTPSAKIAAPIAPPKPVGPPSAKARPKPSSKAATAHPDNASISPVVTATNRAVLAPLEVEVVAGNQHRAVSPGDSSVNVEMQPGTSSASGQTTTPPGSQDSGSGAANATAQVQLSPGTAQVVSRPVGPSYPLLAKQMKVQGAVVLEALISKTGSIQDIQILSGPAILSAAAREAVKQWHFKPYYQGGRPVETEARITVNFTISTF